MNPDADNAADSPHDITSALRQLRPARANIDSSAVFYQAGFNAGQTQRAGHRLGLSHLVATGLIAMMIAAPAGYMAAPGGSRAPQQSGAIASAADTIQEADVAVQNQSPAVPQVKLVEFESAKPAVSSTSELSGLFEFWSRQVGAARDRSERERGATLLAAFHTSCVSSDRVGSEWPDFFISSDALVHRDPEAEANTFLNSPSKVFAASDVRAVAESFEVVQ